ncbi:galactoside O-acetyltransferase [Enterococcus sp. PF1-24]|uniref:sugar O-acetyltransferase n=1 Tax=unclassified Enterococcus TaxID=2608891 RepID=UPI0024756D48|nr:MULTISPECIES: sugar O-acetyltransferase [unclassified Enterococcus]MDH6365275.1 galactoside O-acetyltransferase [Enterococcus sp. PFB1-1]MDH6402395.1 galactoside O-acetyltransferase [Enterococcus sp. PF1-24]
METAEIKRRMDSGEIYQENEEIGKEQLIYSELLYDFNQIRPSNHDEKRNVLEKLLGSFGEDSYIVQPLRANWGKNTYIGKKVYANSNLTLVDDTRIEIHDSVMMGPNVVLATAAHPLEPAIRVKGAQYNLPIVIEKNVWLGAGVIVCPGVTIGENSVIGAGSVVTKDIPANVVAVGTPCRVTKTI